MRKKNLLLKVWLLMALFGLFGSSAMVAQTVDTTNVFDPSLTGVHLVHAKVVFTDVDANGVFDASFNLSDVPIAAWGDYACVVAFYQSGITVRTTAGMVAATSLTNVIIPVSGQEYDLYIAVDVPKQKYQVFVQTAGMPEPLNIYAPGGNFRKAATEINRWSCLHNGSGQPDKVSVNSIVLETNGDVTLASLTANKGTFDPVFDPATTEYTIWVPYGTQSITLSAAAKGMGATVDIYDDFDNKYSSPATIPFTNEGINMAIMVTSLNGEVGQYLVSVYVDEGKSDATLSGIKLSMGAVDPVFAPTTKEYTVMVPIGTTSVDLTATPTFPNATISGTGTIALTDGKGTATISVVSADKTVTETYTVNVVPADGVDYAISLPGVDGNLSNIDISGLGLKTLPYTIEMWIKPTGNQTANSGLLFSRDGTNNAGVQYASNWQNDGSADTPEKIRFMTNIDAQNFGILSKNVVYDDWHHVAVVLTDKTRSIYMDGELQTTEAIVSPVYDYSIGKVYIGYDNGGTARAFKGLIDEVRVWGDSLSAETLNANKQLTLAGNETNLIGYWNFNLTNSAYAIDNSASKLHGVIAGGTYVVANKQNTKLATLAIAGEIVWDNAFEPTRTEYHVLIPAGSTSITLEATAQDAAATVQGAGTIDVSAVNSGSQTITVTNGVSTKVYTVYYLKQTALTLKHSYTFADGTARDKVGTAHGTVVGGAIVGGVYTTSTNGDHITFPAKDIAINTYPAITVEAYVIATGATTNTMLAYFGNTTGTYGTDYFFTSVKNKASISCLNTSAPWNVETGVGGTAYEDGAAHHIVGILSYSKISLYIDGLLVGEAATSANNKIYNLSNAFAYLCKSGYTNDPTWLGSVLEYNIYSGEMAADAIALRATEIPLEDDNSNATLSDLTVDGVQVTGFSPYTLNYNVVIAEGVTTVPAVAAIASQAGATAVVTPAAGIPGTTTIVVTAADGTTKNTINVNFAYSFNTAVKGTNETAIEVYPTVSNSDFTVKTDGKASVVTVYELSGKVVAKQQSAASEQKVAIANKGMYILRVESGNTVKSFKVVKTN